MTRFSLILYFQLFGCFEVFHSKGIKVIILRSPSVAFYKVFGGLMLFVAEVLGFDWERLIRMVVVSEDYFIVIDFLDIVMNGLELLGGHNRVKRII